MQVYMIPTFISVVYTSTFTSMYLPLFSYINRTECASNNGKMPTSEKNIYTIQDIMHNS